MIKYIIIIKQKKIQKIPLGSFIIFFPVNPISMDFFFQSFPYQCTTHRFDLEGTTKSKRGWNMNCEKKIDLEYEKPNGILVLVFF